MNEPQALKARFKAPVAIMRRHIGTAMNCSAPLSPPARFRCKALKKGMNVAKVFSKPETFLRAHQERGAGSLVRFLINCREN